jgi:hypothetical protein
MMVQLEIAEIEKLLLRSGVRVEELSAPSTPGVCAYFLSDSGALSPFVPRRDGLVYVGTSSDLARRELQNHFNSDSTGFSTLRRSLGAILKRQLRLSAIPRGAGRSESNVRNYRFRADEEDRLTEWMHSNLQVAVCPHPNPEPLERELILRLKPLLNLSGWANPDRGAIMALRKGCADEARANR